MRLNIEMIVIAITFMVFSFCGEENEVKESAGANSVQLNETRASANDDTVNNPTLVTPLNNGSLRLTAENGKAAGPEIKYMPEWRAFGWFTVADSVEWDVDLKTGGEYDVYLEWSVSDEEAGKQFILTANDQQLTGTVDKSGSWETFKTKLVGRIKLVKGHQKIIFRSKTKFDKGALLDLREIIFVRV